MVNGQVPWQRKVTACYLDAMTRISVESSGQIATITLDDGKANAINGDLLEELSGALDRAEREEQAIVLAGRPGFFSGGLDLKTLPTLEPDALVGVLSRFGEVMLRLFTFPRPVVAACTGHAIAGGAVLLLTCDERVGTDGPFRVGLNETQIGLNLPRFVVEMARLAVPPPALHAVVTRGDLVSPAEATAHGLLDEVVSADAVMDAATRRAKILAMLPNTAFAHQKQAIRGAAASQGQTALATEVDGYRSFFAGANT
jgi:enoyl-CoA hydratase